jgi:hypothetical protein
VPTDVQVVTRFTADAEPPVRSAAALALRKMTVPEASAQLVSLLADREAMVAQSALLALSEHQLEDAELERIAELVLGGRTSHAIDGRVLRLLVAQRPRLSRASSRATAIENALRVLLGRIETAATIEPTGSGERRAALGPYLPQQRASGSVRAMPAATAHHSSAPPPAMMASTVATTLGTPMQQNLTRQVSATPLNPLCYDESVATVTDQAPIGPIGPIGTLGSYRIVNPPSPANAAELARDRMLRSLGLDPHVRMSVIPQPPPRRAAGATPKAPPSQTAQLRGRST